MKTYRMHQQESTYTANNQDLISIGTLKYNPKSQSFWIFKTNGWQDLSMHEDIMNVIYQLN